MSNNANNANNAQQHGPRRSATGDPASAAQVSSLATGMDGVNGENGENEAEVAGVADADTDDIHEPTPEELREAWEAQRRAKRHKAPASAAFPNPAKAEAKALALAAEKPGKAPDLYEADEPVTLLLPNIIRGVVEGIETKEGRVYFSKTRREFIGTEQPGPVDEETGRAGRSLAVTLTFQGGVCRDVPYSVAKGLKKSRAYRSNDALKVIPNDTPETTFAKLCGVQPMQPGKQAAMLLASDLDAVLAEFDTEQLKAFSAALARRVQASSMSSMSSQGAQRSGILSSQSFQRG